MSVHVEIQVRKANSKTFAEARGMLGAGVCTSFVAFSHALLQAKAQLESLG